MDKTGKVQVTLSEKIEKAFALRNEGNERFKAEDYRDAMKKYHFALLHVKGLLDRSATLQALGADSSEYKCEDVSDEKKQQIKEVEFLCYNNLAATLLKTEKYERALDFASKAIAIKPDNAKALFRKGRAEMHLNDYANAEKDFTKILQLNPTEKSVLKYMKEIEVYKEQSLQKQKQMYSKMF